MTRAQFSQAASADEKWVENAARLLRRRLRYTSTEARWLGLVRVLNQDVGVTLARAAELATEALRHPVAARAVHLEENAAGSAAIVLDLGRYHSTYAAALSAALELGGARRRGRPLAGSQRAIPKSRKRGVQRGAPPGDDGGALARATRHGVDIDALREGLETSPAERLRRLDENATFIHATRSAVTAGGARRQQQILRK